MHGYILRVKIDAFFPSLSRLFLFIQIFMRLLCVRFLPLSFIHSVRSFINIVCVCTVERFGFFFAAAAASFISSGISTHSHTAKHVRINTHAGPRPYIYIMLASYTIKYYMHIDGFGKQ